MAAVALVWTAFWRGWVGVCLECCCAALCRRPRKRPPAADGGEGGKPGALCLTSPGFEAYVCRQHLACAMTMSAGISGLHSDASAWEKVRYPLLLTSHVVVTHLCCEQAKLRP